jgi:hypothetical protein
MTTLARPFSRRRLFTHVAGGASALAISHTLVGSANAAPDKEALRRKAKLRRRRADERDENLSREELALGRALAAKGKHAIASAAAEPGKAFEASSVAVAAARLLEKQPEHRRKRAKDRAKKLFAAPDSERRAKFGAHADETPEVHKKKRREKDVDDAARKVKAKHDKKKEKKDGPTFERIEFHLNWVDCVEETDEVGADEILLGGQLVRPDGEVVSIQSFKVSDDFDQGESRNYDYAPCDLGMFVPDFIKDDVCPNGGAKDPHRGKVLAKANLRKGTYLLLLMLGEEDTAGGFALFVKDLYKSLEPEIDKALTAGATALTGPFGPALAWAIGEVLDFLVGLIDNPDDAIAMRFWRLTFHDKSLAYARENAKDPLEAPKGAFASTMRKVSFVGDGGRYDMGLHWRAMT